MRLLRKWLLGTYLPNEYVCLKDVISDALRIQLVRKHDEIDVSRMNILLSYQPLVIGLSLSDPNLSAWTGAQSLIRLGFRTTDEEIAWLEMERLSEWRMGETNLILFSGLRGKHKFLADFYQWTNRAYEGLRSLKPRDGALSNALYDQVRIAYSIPRNVSVISLGDGNRFNFFPTDLHGEVGEGFYAGALRIGGKACQQVEQLKQIVISKVSSESYHETYGLGKNHMSDLREITLFHAGETRSEQFGLPLLQSTVSYKELVWKNSIDVGLHRIHLYEVVNSKVLNTDKTPLSHIHRYYAQWRANHRLKTEYLLR